MKNLKMTKKIISSLMTITMLMGVYVPSALAADTYDVYLDSMNIGHDELLSLVHDKHSKSIWAIEKNITIKGGSQIELDTNMKAIDEVTFEEGETYTVKAGSYGTFCIIPYLRTPVEFDVKSDTVVNYYEGKTLSKKDLFNAIYNQSTPMLVADDEGVYVEYNVDGSWVDFTNQKGKRAFGTQAVESVRIRQDRGTAKSNDWKDIYSSNYSSACAVSLVDQRKPVHIALSEQTPNILFGSGNAYYDEELRKYISVKDESEIDVSKGSITLEINEGQEITVNGTYNVKVTYSDSDNEYKPVSDNFNFNVYSLDPTYSAELDKSGNGSVSININGEPEAFDTAKMISFTQEVSNGFTITATPDNGCYTASITAKNGEIEVAKSTKETPNELTVPAGAFENGDVCTVSVIFKEASANFNNKITIHNRFRVNKDMEGIDRPAIEREIFKNALVSSEPVEFTYDNNVKGMVMKRSLGDYGFKDTLLKSDFFGRDAKEYVKITYEYNGKKFTTDYIEVTFFKWDSAINVSDDPIELNEGDSYESIIKSKATVVDSEVNPISGATVSVSGLDENLFDKNQSVTLTYDGNDYYNGKTVTANVNIKSVGYTVNKGIVTGEGSITTDGRIRLTDSTKNGFSFKVKPDNGKYLVSVTITKNGEAFKEYNKDSAEITSITDELTINVADSININDKYVVSAVFADGVINLKSGISLPGYLKHKEWKNNSTTLDVCKAEVFNYLYESSLPTDVTVNDVNIYYDIGTNNSWRSLDFKPDLGESFATGYELGSRDSEKIRITYSFNNSTLEAVTTITFFEVETETKLSEEALTLNEGADYVQAIKDLASVNIKDGNEISGAGFEVTGLDEAVFNQPQTVTVTYAGKSGVYLSSYAEIEVTLIPQEKYDAAVADVVDGDENRTIKVTLVNNDSSNLEGDLFFAAYDEDGKLCEIVYNKEVSYNNGSNDLSFVTAKKDYAEYKIFVWDSISGMKPIFTKTFTSLK